MMKGKEKLAVRIGKVDLDLVTAGFLLGVERGDDVRYVPKAEEVDLENREIICLECGYFGFRDAREIELGNFDHHGGKLDESAAAQVWSAYDHLLACSVELSKREVDEDDLELGKDFLERFDALMGMMPSNAAFIQTMLKKKRWEIPKWDDEFEAERRVFRRLLVEEYVNPLDLRGPGMLRQFLKKRRISYPTIFPTVSDVVSGILVVEKNPVEAFHVGVEFLKNLEECWLGGWEPKGTRVSLEEYFQWKYGHPYQPWPQVERAINQIRKGEFELERWLDEIIEEVEAIVGPLSPEQEEWWRREFTRALEGYFRRHCATKVLCLWGPVPVEDTPWEQYPKAKKEYDRRGKEVLKKAKWTTTRSGLRVGYVETEWIGAVGALYGKVESGTGKGADIAVVLNPAYGPRKLRKFTIAGNGIRVDSLLEKLNKLEPGWGGPSHGTIIGSPRERSSTLKLETVIEIVKTL